MWVRNVVTGEKRALDYPKSNVLQFITEDGSKISARPSGTEPKIKFYFSLVEQMQSKDQYKEKQKAIMDRIEAIKKDLNLN